MADFGDYEVLFFKSISVKFNSVEKIVKFVFAVDFAIVVIR